MLMIMNYNVYFDTKVFWCIFVRHSTILVQNRNLWCIKGLCSVWWNNFFRLQSSDFIYVVLHFEKSIDFCDCLTKPFLIISTDLSKFFRMTSEYFFYLLRIFITVILYHDTSVSILNKSYIRF